MRTFNIHEAKTHLSRLVDEVEQGEPFVIAKAGKPMALVMPIDGRKRAKRRIGADAIAEHPFAEAFSQKVRTALRPFVGYKEAHPNLCLQLQEQLDRALRYFCHGGDLKWVSLLMWAGADPRTSGPRQGEVDDPDCYETALQLAAYGESVDVLKRLKPNPEIDDLVELLVCASMFPRKEMISYAR
jgi:prevent-host-death family protein